MIDLGTSTQYGFLDFDKIPHMRVIGQNRLGAQARKRPDFRPRAHRRTINMREWRDLRAFGNLRIANHTVSTNLYAIAQLNLTFKHAIDINRHIHTTDQFTTHVNTRRIAQTHTLLQQLLRNLSLINPLQLRQLRFAVDAQRFPLGRWLFGHDLQSIGYRHRDYIGEVILTLRILIGQLRQPAFECRRRRHQNTRVDLMNGQLIGCGIFLLHNLAHIALRITHNPTIAGRIV